MRANALFQDARVGRLRHPVVHDLVQELVHRDKVVSHRLFLNVLEVLSEDLWVRGLKPSALVGWRVTVAPRRPTPMSLCIKTSSSAAKMLRLVTATTARMTSGRCDWKRWRCMHRPRARRVPSLRSSPQSPKTSHRGAQRDSQKRFACLTWMKLTPVSGSWKQGGGTTPSSSCSLKRGTKRSRHSGSTSPRYSRLMRLCRTHIGAVSACKMP